MPQRGVKWKIITLTGATSLPIHHLLNKKTTTWKKMMSTLTMPLNQLYWSLMSKTLAYNNSSDRQTQPQDNMATIPEEVDPAEHDTLVFNSKESEEEWFDTTIDTTSNDSATTMGKPVTAAFISDLVQIPTEQVRCLQVTHQLQESLDQYPPKLTEKAFEHIYQILQVLDKYLVDNLKQHRHCMSPDSE